MLPTKRGTTLVEVLIASTLALLILGLAYWFLQQGGLATRSAGLRMECFQRLQRAAGKLDDMLSSSSPEALAAGTGWLSSFAITGSDTSGGRIFSTQLQVAQLSGATLCFFAVPDSAQTAVGLKPSASSPSLPSATQITVLTSTPAVFQSDDISTFTVELLPKGYHYTLVLTATGITGPITQRVEREGDFRL